MHPGLTNKAWTAWREVAFTDSKVKSAERADMDSDGRVIKDTYLQISMLGSIPTTNLLIGTADNIPIISQTSKLLYYVAPDVQGRNHTEKTTYTLQFKVEGWSSDKSPIQRAVVGEKDMTTVDNKYNTITEWNVAEQLGGAKVFYQTVELDKEYHIGKRQSGNKYAIELTPASVTLT